MYVQLDFIYMYLCIIEKCIRVALKQITSINFYSKNCNEAKLYTRLWIILFKYSVSVSFYLQQRDFIKDCISPCWIGWKPAKMAILLRNRDFAPP